MLNKKILIIDDAYFMRNLIKKFIKEKPPNNICFSTIEAKDGLEGITKYFEKKPDIVFLDYKIPNINGLDVYKEILSKDKNVKVIVISNNTEQSIIDSFMKLGAIKYIKKPFEKELLYKTLDNIFKSDNIEDNSIISEQKNNSIIQEQLKQEEIKDKKKENKTETKSEIIEDKIDFELEENERRKKALKTMLKNITNKEDSTNKEDIINKKDVINKKDATNKEDATNKNVINKKDVINKKEDFINKKNDKTLLNNENIDNVNNIKYNNKDSIAFIYDKLRPPKENNNKNYYEEEFDNNNSDSDNIENIKKEEKKHGLFSKIKNFFK